MDDIHGDMEPNESSDEASSTRSTSDDAPLQWAMSLRSMTPDDIDLLEASNASYQNAAPTDQDATALAPHPMNRSADFQAQNFAVAEETTVTRIQNDRYHQGTQPSQQNPVGMAMMTRLEGFQAGLGHNPGAIALGRQFGLNVRHPILDNNSGTRQPQQENPNIPYIPYNPAAIALGRQFGSNVGHPILANNPGTRQPQQENPNNPYIPYITPADNTCIHQPTPCHCDIHRAAANLQNHTSQNNFSATQSYNPTAGSANLRSAEEENTNTTGELAPDAHANPTRLFPFSNPQNLHSQAPHASAIPRASPHVLRPGAQQMFKLIRDICALSKGHHVKFLAVLRRMELACSNDVSLSILVKAYRVAHAIMLSEENTEDKADAESLLQALQSLYTTIQRQYNDNRPGQSGGNIPMPIRTHDRERSQSPQHDQNRERRRSRSPARHRALSPYVDQHIPESPPPPYSEFALPGHRSMAEETGNSPTPPAGDEINRTSHQDPGNAPSVAPNFTPQEASYVNRHSMDSQRWPDATESQGEHLPAAGPVPPSTFDPPRTQDRPRANFSGGGLRFNIPRVSQDAADQTHFGQTQNIQASQRLSFPSEVLTHATFTRLSYYLLRRLESMGITCQTHPELNAIVYSQINEHASRGRINAGVLMNDIFDRLRAYEAG